jgi:predicted nucleic acid-binding protein
VNAANGGLFRLFSAQHVVSEIVEHSEEWTAGTGVSRDQFLARWLTDYLPLIRVVALDEQHIILLSPDEASRVRKLSAVDKDDVPSAILALALGAFYLSDDRAALRAVYGENYDFTEHDEWVNALKAGGDTGELIKIITFALNLSTLAGSGLVSGTRRLVTATSPWILLPAAGMAILAWLKTSDETKIRLKSIGWSMLGGISGALLAYAEVKERFDRVTPTVPGWDSLADTNNPRAVLARACIYTLARSTESEHSAAELTQQLPLIRVPHGETKVRETLREQHQLFTEVWRGRWQVGHVAPTLMRYLQASPHLADPST